MLENVFVKVSLIEKEDIEINHIERINSDKVKSISSSNF